MKRIQKRKRLKLAAVTVLSAAMVFSLVSCAAASSGSGASDSSRYVTVNGKKLFVLRIPTQTGFNEFDIAIAKGYFAQNGIQVKYTGVLKAGVSDVQSVVEGDNDIFTNHPVTVAQAVEGGAKIHIIAPGMVDNAQLVHMDYFVKKGGSIQSAADLKNRKFKVAVSGTDTCTDLVANEWFKQQGIPKSNVTYVVEDDSQIEQSVAQGLVDIGCLHPPFIKKAQIDGELTSLFTSYDAVKSPAGGASIRGVSDAFASKYPQVITGFIKAIDEAHHFINAHPDEADAIEAKALNMPVNQVAPFYYDPTDYVQKSYIQTWINMMVDDGIAKPGEFKATDLYTNKYNPYHKGV